MEDELLHQPNELRETSILCDTTIRAEGQDFAAHKCVLSAASAFFRALFSSQMKETKNNMVELPEAKSNTVSDVLQFIYTRKVSINSSNAQDLAMISDYLIIPSLKTRASDFLALESFACQYNCQSLKQVAVTCNCENFVAITKSEDFRTQDEMIQNILFERRYFPTVSAATTVSSTVRDLKQISRRTYLGFCKVHRRWCCSVWRNLVHNGC